MGGNMTGPRWSRDHTLLASASRTTSGYTNAKNVGEYIEGVFFLEITAKSGTNPTLDVALEYSPDQGATWFTSGTAFTQADDISKQSLPVSALGNHIRFAWEIGGSATPSFTFSIKASLKA